MVDTTGMDEAGLEELLSEPTESLREAVAGLDGDIAVLGAGGKMGPTLSMMLKKTWNDKRVYAVSRFSNSDVKKRIQRAGIETFEADLLDESIYPQLPQVKNVFYLVGRKFGAKTNQPLTWALNSFVPALVARHYRDSRIVAFSTGNVYPLVDIHGSGASEETPPRAVGEYAQSCLGRERVFEYFSGVNKTETTLVRLNYANEPRYGIIVDLSLKIMREEPIDLTMGAVNMIWQRDAHLYIIRSILLARSRPAFINVTGPDKVMIRDLAGRIGRELGKKPRFVSSEAPTALLSDASYCLRTFGYPEIPLDEMVSMIVAFVRSGKKLLNKPTKYEVRNGDF